MGCATEDHLTWHHDHNIRLRGYLSETVSQKNLCQPIVKFLHHLRLYPETSLSSLLFLDSSLSLTCDSYLDQSLRTAKKQRRPNLTLMSSLDWFLNYKSQSLAMQSGEFSKHKVVFSQITKGWTFRFPVSSVDLKKAKPFSFCLFRIRCYYSVPRGEDSLVETSRGAFHFAESWTLPANR